MAVPVVQLVFPSSGATGAILASTVWATFDQEIDEDSIPGSFFVIGPDHDLWTGPDYERWDKALQINPDWVLRSPGYQGIVQGTWSIETLDAQGSIYSGESYSPGSGLTSKIIFTPTEILAATTEYRVYLAGAEVGDTDPSRGIRTRTVYDPQLGPNLGNGNIVTEGSYTGTVADTFTIEITIAGGVGVAQYEWYKQTVPSIKHTGYCSPQSRPLSDGVDFYFSGDDFRVGDTYTVRVYPAEYMAGIDTWLFTTGTGSIETVPTETSTSPTGSPVPSVPPYITDRFAVESASPSHRDTQLPLTRNAISIQFNQDLDATTVTQESVRVYAEHILGGYGDDESIGEIAKKLSVSGDTLTITI
jgi:hypothetical protein